MLGQRWIHPSYPVYSTLDEGPDPSCMDCGVTLSDTAEGALTGWDNGEYRCIPCDKASPDRILHFTERPLWWRLMRRPGIWLDRMHFWYLCRFGTPEKR